MGISDPWIILGYVLSIGLAIACIAYGFVKRNEGAEKNG